MPSTSAAEDEIDDAAEWVETEAEPLLEFVNERPLTAMAIAVACGFVLAKFLR